MEKEKQLAYMKAWNKKNIKISRQVRDIIHAYIMSDGYVSPYGILTVEQSIQQQKFVEWLCSQLKPVCKNEPCSSIIKDVVRFDQRTKKKTFSKRFFTKSVLVGFHKMWYKPYIKPCDSPYGARTGFKKQLPKSINCFFNSTFLTVWFAGDGTKILGSVGAKYEATAFQIHERNLLKDLFLRKFDINVLINRAGQSKAGQTQWTININASEYQKFRALITQIDLIENLFPGKLHKA